jgi:Tfp pilus assembly protein PilX
VNIDQLSQNKWRNQRGVALVIGLIFLVIMSIIGLAAMGNVTLQEQINGNTVHKNNNFQQAEQDLMAAEQLILAPNIEIDPDVILVLNDSSLALTDAALLIEANWVCGSTAEATKCKDINVPRSRAKIEYLSDVDDAHKFRVTVRTEFGRSVVTLQSVFVR